MYKVTVRAFHNQMSKDGYFNNLDEIHTRSDGCVFVIQFILFIEFESFNYKSNLDREKSIFIQKIDTI